MKVAVIGAAGKMGFWFTKFFLEQGDSVIVSGRSKEKLEKIKDKLDVEVADNVTAVKKADKVLICVPIENFENVIKEVYSSVKPNQVIMDICSIKEFAVDIMHKYIKIGTTLGTHPMFGPDAKSLENQNFVLTPTNTKERHVANEFKAWLETKKAKVSIISPRKHDELTCIVLGLSHFIGMVTYDTLSSRADFAETIEIAGPTYRLLTTLAEKVASQDADLYASLQTKLPGIDKIEDLFCQKTKEWLDLTKKRNKAKITERMKSTKLKMKKFKS